MRELGIAGVTPGRKPPRTTVPDTGAERPADLLGRDFTADAPNRRWVADLNPRADPRRLEASSTKPRHPISSSPPDCPGRAGGLQGQALRAAFGRP